MTNLEYFMDQYGVFKMIRIIMQCFRTTGTIFNFLKSSQLDDVDDNVVDIVIVFFGKLLAGP